MKAAMHLLYLTLLLSPLACASRITGNEGNFSFAYFTDDDFADFNKPIAVGAMLDIEVSAVSDGLPVTLSEASTDDAAVLDVASFQGNRVTVMGMGDGGALLSVSGTTTSGVSLSDSVNLLSRVPEVLDLSHTCSDLENAAYLSGTTVLVPFELSMANGQPVIGYGYYPVGVEGEASLNTAGSDQTWIRLDVSGTGPITLTSTIDSTTLNATGVSEDQIDGIEEPIPFVIEDIDAGDTNAFYVRPMVGDLTVCQADLPKTVESLSPEVCTVKTASSSDLASQEFGWFEITGVSEGTCTYTVTYNGVTETFTYPIQP